MRFTRLNRPRVIACAAVAALVGAAALGSSPLSRPAPTVAPPGSAPRQLSFVDPVTGLPRELAPADLQALQSPTVAAPPQRVVSPTPGLTGLNLSDDQMVYSVATRGADGKIVISEARGSKAAARMVAGSAAPVLQAGKEKRDDR